MAGTLPPPLRPASTNGDRLRQTPATAGGAGAGAPITAADAAVIKIVLASWQTLRDPVETFNPRQGRGEDVSHHSQHPKLLVSLCNASRAKSGKPRGERARAPTPPAPRPLRRHQPPLAARQHMDSTAPSTGDAQPQTANGQQKTRQATYLFRESSCHAPSAQSCESPARPPVLAQASAQSGQTRSSSCATVTGHHSQSRGGSFKQRRTIAASARLRCSDHMERRSQTRPHPRSSRNSRSERPQQGPRASRLAPCSIRYAHSAHARQPDKHEKQHSRWSREGRPPPCSPRSSSSPIPPPLLPRPLQSHLQFDFGVTPRLDAKVGEVPLE